MDLRFERGCHCCERSQVKMDIDAALNELGMLSTVTESRRQYLKERSRTQSESSASQSCSTTSSPPTRFSSTHHIPGSYKIVHIDPKFVTSFSDTLTLNATPQVADTLTNDDVFPDMGKEYRKPPDAFISQIERKRLFRTQNIATRNRRLQARARNRKPYEVPWRLTQSIQESDLIASMERSSISDTKHSKSNSSSPVKSFSENCLTRSRSLDHLDLIPLLSLKPLDLCDDKNDIDHVASEMKELQVSDDS